MTEKEKMLSGMLYDADDETLVNDRLKCKEMCFDFNNLRPSQVDERTALIKKILGSTGEKIWIEPDFWCDYGYNITVGENFYANHNLVILDCIKVEFGKNCFIAPNCSFYTPNHPLDAEQRNSGMEIEKPIKVGDNVWIGGNTTVLPGVRIGDNTVIGAGSVVTKDIPSGVVAVGNPCKVLRKITEKDKI